MVKARVRWGRQVVGNKKRVTEPMYLGRLVDPRVTGGRQVKEMKRDVRRVAAKMRAHMPWLHTAQVLMLGLVLNKYIYRSVVNIPIEWQVQQARVKMAGGIKYAMGVDQRVHKWVV